MFRNKCVNVVRAGVRCFSDGSASKKRKLKAIPIDPLKPKGSSNPFALFLAQSHQNNPSSEFGGGRMKECSEKWKIMNESDKQFYINLANANREKLLEYKNSSAAQMWREKCESLPNPPANSWNLFISDNITKNS
eukprot:UN33149